MLGESNSFRSAAQWARKLVEERPIVTRLIASLGKTQTQNQLQGDLHMSEAVKVTDNDALAHILGGANSATVFVSPLIGKMINLNIVKDGVVTLFGVGAPATSFSGALVPGAQYSVAADGTMTLDRDVKVVVPPKTVGSNKTRSNNVQYRKS